jgi:hypothetical protein
LFGYLVRIFCHVIASAKCTNIQFIFSYRLYGQQVVSRWKWLSAFQNLSLYFNRYWSSDRNRCTVSIWILTHNKKPWWHIKSSSKILRSPLNPVMSSDRKPFHRVYLPLKLRLYLYTELCVLCKDKGLRYCKFRVGFNFQLNFMINWSLVMNFNPVLFLRIWS